MAKVEFRRRCSLRTGSGVGAHDLIVRPVPPAAWTEGVGEDFLPGVFDPAVVDRWVRVPDRDAFHIAG